MFASYPPLLRGPLYTFHSSPVVFAFQTETRRARACFILRRIPARERSRRHRENLNPFAKSQTDTRLNNSRSLGPSNYKSPLNIAVISSLLCPTLTVPHLLITRGWRGGARSLKSVFSSAFTILFFIRYTYFPQYSREAAAPLVCLPPPGSTHAEPTYARSQCCFGGKTGKARVISHGRVLALGCSTRGGKRASFFFLGSFALLFFFGS